MSKLLRGLGWATCGALALTVSAAGQSYPQGYPNSPNQQPYPTQNYPSYPAQMSPRGYPAPAQAYPPQGYPASPPPNASGQPVATSSICVRLESQLATLNASPANSALADQIKSAEDAIAKQQADLDRTEAQARKVGCAGQGFFSLFSGLAPQCGPLNSQIDQMRGNIDRMMSDLEQLKSGNDSQQGQRTALIGQLAQNNCGSQYTQAVRATGPQGFFEALLGGGGTVVSPGGNGAPVGTYRTVCVRTCDGFYFPISYSTVPSRFPADADACQRLCPAAPAALYTYHNPGEEIEQAVSVDGAPYTALPSAFRYRKEVVAGCSCRKAGETWAQTLHSADDTTLESGDIVVTDQNEKALTQVPRGAAARPPVPAAVTPTANAVPDSKNTKVRVVGPPFLSSQ